MRGMLKVFVVATAAMCWAASPPAARVHRAPHGPGEAVVPAQPWSVFLNGADGSPLVRTDVLVRMDGDPVKITTDDAGRLELAGADSASFLAIEVASRKLEVLGPGAIVHLDDLVPLEVEAVDGSTGAVLPGAVRNPPSHLARGPYEGVNFDVAVPEGYLAPEVGAGASRISRHAERVRLIARLSREADIRLRVLDAGGGPVAAAEVARVFAGGPEPLGRPWSELPEPVEDEDWNVFEGVPERATIAWRAAPTDAEGWTRVRGVPELLDEQYWIVASDGRHEAFAGVRIDFFGERHVRDVRLPAAATEVWQDFRLAYTSMRFG